MSPLLLFLLDQLVEFGPVFVEDVGQSQGNLVVVLLSDVPIHVRVEDFVETGADGDEGILIAQLEVESLPHPDTHIGAKADVTSFVAV